LVSCHYCLPGLRWGSYLPSHRTSPPCDQYQIILVGDSGTCANNLLRVITRQCRGRESNSRVLDCESNAVTVTLPKHMSGYQLLVFRMATCLEKPKISGNLTGKCQGKILSGKIGLKLFIVSCIFASILDFAELVYFILVSDHALLHSYPTTDNNACTSMI